MERKILEYKRKLKKYSKKVENNISNIFLEYKKQKNPLQQLYKLIMNSCYGKTIEKPVDKELVYVSGEEKIKKYITRNYNSITEIIQIKDSKISAIKQVVPIDQHFNFSLLGIQVLSMSKRIMNEVMCLAYDIGCRIYYQDTDSMHIVNKSWAISYRFFIMYRKRRCRTCSRKYIPYEKNVY